MITIKRGKKGTTLEGNRVVCKLVIKTWAACGSHHGLGSRLRGMALMDNHPKGSRPLYDELIWLARVADKKASLCSKVVE